MIQLRIDRTQRWSKCIKIYSYNLKKLFRVSWKNINKLITIESFFILTEIGAIWAWTCASHFLCVLQRLSP